MCHGVVTAPENKYVKASGKSTTRLAVGGLCGGHSGIDIHRHRANALKLLARILGDMPAGDDIRSPSERLHVPSLSRLWDFLVALLQSLSQDR